MGARLLTVQTASSAGSLALTEGDVLLAETTLNVQSTHNDWLINAIKQMLESAKVMLADLDGFGIASGPGSFTGLRVGLATVKGLAIATQKPIVPVSSLYALAYQACFSRMPICALLDARKKEVYAGLFSWEAGQLRPLLRECVVKPETLVADLNGDVAFIGEGSRVYRTLIVRQLGGRAHFARPGLDLLRAGNVAMLAYQAWESGCRKRPEEVIPDYIRPPEAELNWGKR